MATFTLNALEEFLQIFAQRPYSLLLRPRSISGRLEDHGHVQKLSRYKSSQVSLLEERNSSITAIFHGAIKAFASETLSSSYFVSFYHFMTVRIFVVSINPFRPSHPIAKLESDTHPASKAPSQSTSIILSF
ncbi:hypothetical protein IGI04_001914, partial [Brassica rapa subsp. trilocularis]